MDLLIAWLVGTVLIGIVLGFILFCMSLAGAVLKRLLPEPSSSNPKLEEIQQLLTDVEETQAEYRASIARRQ